MKRKKRMHQMIIAKNKRQMNNFRLLAKKPSALQGQKCMIFCFQSRSRKVSPGSLYATRLKFASLFNYGTASIGCGMGNTYSKLFLFWDPPGQRKSIFSQHKGQLLTSSTMCLSQRKPLKEPSGFAEQPSLSLHCLSCLKLFL